MLSCQSVHMHILDSSSMGRGIHRICWKNALRHGESAVTKTYTYVSWFRCVSTNRNSQCPLQCSRRTKPHVTTGSPCRSGDRTENVWRSEGSWLQRTEGSVAVHTAVQESWSAGIKTEQSWEEGDAPNWEQQRDSCPSRTTSVGFGQGIGHLPVSVTWVGPCRRWEDVDGSIEVVLDEEGQRWVSQIQDMDGVRP